MQNRQVQKKSIDGFSYPQVGRPRQRLNQPSLQPKPQPVIPPAEPLEVINSGPSVAFSPINMDLPEADPSTPAARSKLPMRFSWSKKRRIITSVLALLIIGFGLGSWYGSKLIGNLDKTFHGNVISDVKAAFSNTPLTGEAQGRVNILIAGDSADDPGHAGGDLTDSIMVLSINTKDHTGFMLSIPRDLWVNIPGLGNQKINAANDVTNFSASGYPSGGMGQLQQIVQTDLGIPIDYYALINYNAFKDAVNAVGGITIDIQSPDPRGLYDAYTNLKLPNGNDTLNGQQALNLARARGDDSSGDVSYGFPATDFDRTQHQRQMGVAIAKKAMSAGVLANPLKVSDLFSALSKNVQTNLTLQNALRLAQITKTLNLNSLGSDTYSSTLTGSTTPLLMTYKDPDSGQYALIPTAGLGDYSQLQNYYQQLTSSDPAVKENASVVILNGSNVIGLAKKEEAALKAQGVSNVTIADADSEYPGTMLIDNSNGADPNTKAALQKLFPGTVTTASNRTAEAQEAQNYTANFVVVLGQNWDGTNVTNP